MSLSRLLIFIHDAIKAIFNHIRLKPKSVYDGDIEKCFDKIDREALLNKIHSPHTIKRLIRAWLEAGIMDDGQLLYPEAGTPQGGVISPLLSNIYLNEVDKMLERAKEVARNGKFTYIEYVRFADDRAPQAHNRKVLKGLRLCKSCTRDGGSPSKAGLPGQALNNHELRW